MNKFQKAQEFIPGGVNSPVRAFSSVGRDPLFIQSASGSLIKDSDSTTSTKSHINMPSYAFYINLN